MSRRCPFCFVLFTPKSGAANRADAIGAPLYCGMRCAGLARRKHKAPEQKKAEKAAYDREYRQRDPEARKAYKALYYQETRDPKREAAIRKARMHLHVEYCRRPEYVAKKREYDKQLRAAEYGPFAETYLLLLDLERELRKQATKYERRKQKGYFTRSAQQRRRELWQAMQRN